MPLRRCSGSVEIEAIVRTIVSRRSACGRCMPRRRHPKPLIRSGGLTSSLGSPRSRTPSNRRASPSWRSDEGCEPSMPAARVGSRHLFEMHDVAEILAASALQRRAGLMATQFFSSALKAASATVSVGTSMSPDLTFRRGRFRARPAEPSSLRVCWPLVFGVSSGLFVAAASNRAWPPRRRHPQALPRFFGVGRRRRGSPSSLRRDSVSPASRRLSPRRGARHAQRCRLTGAGLPIKQTRNASSRALASKRPTPGHEPPWQAPAIVVGLTSGD
jgi:hypothetical protein